MSTTTQKLSNGNSIHYQERNGTFYRVAMDLANGTRDLQATPEPVIAALEDARQNGKRVRLFYGDERGRDWMEECDVTGTIGRSTGPIKIPILLSNAMSKGGGSILDQCIVRLFVDGKEVYRQSNYQEPALRVVPVTEPELKGSGYSHAVDRCEGGQWTNQARFKNAASAQRYVEFMQGKRLTK